LLQDIEKFVPSDYNKYYEPFLGGGALFFKLEPSVSQLSDINSELINTYQQVKNNVNDIIKQLKSMKYNKSTYYKIRSLKTTDKVVRAARFIYLNRTCWNGLYRENKKGEFNVPIGKYENPLICDSDNLINASRMLEKTELTKGDFKLVLKNCSKGDLIYLDPPYVTSHKDNGFIEYNSKIFSLEDQLRLRNTMIRLDKKGCKLIMSNADHKFIKKIYKNFNINYVSRKSLIAADTLKRKDVKELIITNF